MHIYHSNIPVSFFLKTISDPFFTYLAVGRMDSHVLLMARGRIVYNTGVGVLTMQLYTSNTIRAAFSNWTVHVFFLSASFLALKLDIKNLLQKLRL